MAFKLADAFVRFFADLGGLRTGTAEAKSVVRDASSAMAADAKAAASAISQSHTAAGGSAQSLARNLAGVGATSALSAGRIQGLAYHLNATAVATAGANNGLAALTIAAARNAVGTGQAANATQSFAQQLGSALVPGLFQASFAADLAARGITSIVEVSREAAEALVRMYAMGVREGVEFNALLETSRLGIGALIQTYATFSDGTGRAADASYAFALSQREAAKAVELARIAAVETTATFPEMLRALQEGMPQALQAGFNTEQVVEFTQVMTQAAGAIGLPVYQLGQEIRGVFEVDLSRNSRIARMLFSNIGMSADELRSKFRQLAAEGKLFDFLMERMKAFSMAGDQLAVSTTGALSNLSDASQQILGAGFAEATRELTEAALDLTKTLITVDEKGHAAFDPRLVEGIKATWTGVNELANVTADVIGLFTGVEIEGVGAFGKVSGAVQMLADDIRELKHFMDLQKEGFQQWNPLRLFTMSREVERRMLEEQDRANAKAIAGYRHKQEYNRTKETIGVAGLNNETEGAMPGTSMLPSGISFGAIQDDADTANQIEALSRQNALAALQVQIASTVNQHERARLELKLKQIAADNRMADALAEAEKGDATPRQRQQLAELLATQASLDKAAAQRASNIAEAQRALAEAITTKQAQLELAKFNGDLETASRLIAEIGEKQQQQAKLTGNAGAEEAARTQTEIALRSLDLEKNARATAIAQIELETARLLGQTEQVRNLTIENDRLAVARLRAQGLHDQASALERQQNARREVEDRQQLLEFDRAVYAVENDILALRARLSGQPISVEAAQAREYAEAMERIAEIRNSDKFTAQQKSDLSTLEFNKLQLRMAEIELELGDDWSAMTSRMLLDFKTVAQQIEDGFADTVGNVRSLFSDVLFAGITGNLDEIDDAFKNFFKNVARRMADFLADRAVQMVMQQLFGAALSAYAGGSGGFVSGSITSSGAGSTFGSLVSSGANLTSFASASGYSSLSSLSPASLGGAAITAPPRESVIHQRIVIAPELIAAGRSTPDEIVSIVSMDMLDGGPTYRALRLRESR